MAFPERAKVGGEGWACWDTSQKESGILGEEEGKGKTTGPVGEIPGGRGPTAISLWLWEARRAEDW